MNSDLEVFYGAIDAVAVEVEQLLHLPATAPASVESRQQAVLRLCRAFQGWQDSKSAVFVTCPGLFLQCKSLQDKLSTYIHSQCRAAWQHVLGLPLKLVSTFITSALAENDVKADEEELKQGQQRISDGLLLATGFNEEESKKDAQCATGFVSAVLNLLKVSQDGKASQARTVRAMHQLFIDIGLLSAQEPLGFTTVLDMHQVKFLGFDGRQGFHD